MAGRCFFHSSLYCPLSNCLMSMTNNALFNSLDIIGMGKEGEELVILKIKLVEALRMANTKEYGVSLVF